MSHVRVRVPLTVQLNDTISSKQPQHGYSYIMHAISIMVFDGVVIHGGNGFNPLEAEPVLVQRHPHTEVQPGVCWTSGEDSSTAHMFVDINVGDAPAEQWVEVITATLSGIAWETKRGMPHTVRAPTFGKVVSITLLSSGQPTAAPTPAETL